MVSSRAATAGLALLCVLALAFAAATLPDPNDAPGTAGNGSDDAGLIPEQEPPEPADFPVRIPPIVRDVLLAALLVGLFAAVVVLVYDPFETLSIVVRTLLLAAAVILAMILLAYLLQLLTGDVASGGGGPGLQSGETGGGLGGGGGLPAAEILFGIGGVAAVLLVAIVVSYLYRDERRLERAQTALEGLNVGGRGVPSAIGRVAGRAADRIERNAGAPVENEVFRAWQEMTERLDAPSPRSSTPEEFAEAAIEAGLDPADISELTDLFREVRYGGADPTPDREERAAAVLRRIEREYAERGG